MSRSARGPRHRHRRRRPRRPRRSRRLRRPVRTDHSQCFGTERYLHDHPFLTEASAKALVAANVACVGIDSLNIDSTDDSARPVHTTLLRAEIPIIEHLADLGALPPSGFTFTAVPPKIAGAGTFTVRAFATVPDETDAS
jgi:arylformamidase